MPYYPIIRNDKFSLYLRVLHNTVHVHSSNLISARIISTPA